MRHYLTTKYDALCTPRASHAADLLSRLLFFVLLASYTLDPPRKPSIYIASSEYIHVREILLILFGASIPWVPLGLPFALTTLAFAFKLPSVPFAGDFSFNVLLVSLFLLIFQFHIPVPPSPIYLFPLESTLPFILLLCHRTLHMFTRVFAFFFPALLISFYLLSLSLADNFLQLQNSGPATPMESRGSFLFFSVVILILIGVSFFALAPVSLPSPVARHGQLWDVYSGPLGTAARVNFVRVLICYAEPYPYPPPFNLVYFTFIWVPQSVLRLLNVTSSIAVFEAFRRTLWRILVGPVFVVVTICTLWLP
ncbi:hypothetical protein Moror_136 [Moniliophthora roreri MCA 2997]|uniref:Uncharacterized protein n=1 Tax=Moniliophthora roreri (strain MCA 2997) TaxID=1381753 RepID=V2XZV0_MONRO|nr:hypothetical protein Moror_136 [Moniliophthora roreri MCA 2997]